jgi:thiol peroxidase
MEAIMNRPFPLVYPLFLSMLFLVGCVATTPSIPINYQSIEPGGIVQRGDQKFKLLGFPLKLGDHLPDTPLVNASNFEDVKLSAFKGKVMLLSIVPSIDTKVCERQSHYLGEQGDQLPEDIVRITISRDTPFAQARFAREAKLTDIIFLSDYRKGDFGLATGLLVDEIQLLTRAVLVADQSGIVRYMQIVPQLANLPDMDTAFQKAEELDRGRY